MAAMGFEPEALGRQMVEGALEALPFARAFLFIVRQGRAAGEAVEDFILEPVAARMRRGHGAQEAWASVRNAEFAVNRTVIARALASPQPVGMNDCLLQPTTDGDEQHRAVVCMAFDVAPSIKGVLYLDRGLGQGPPVELELEPFAAACARLGPIFSRGHLASRLAQLESPGESGAAEAGEEAAPEIGEIPSFHGIVGRSEKLQKIFAMLQKIKDSDLSVCIFGESGTGKELMARAIHETSRRREKLFIAENCGAIPESLLESELFGHMRGSFTGADEDKKGLFELASGGTLFLDEISDMSEGMQRKLLRVLQEGMVRPIGGKGTTRVDVRVVCASNRDLKTLVQKGTFRADLYYRLNVITIEVPPLRERPDDIPILVAHFAAQTENEEGVRRRFSQSALRALCEYPWPGNIRELRNVVRRAMVTSSRRLIARKDLTPFLSRIGATPRSGDNIEQDEDTLLLRIPRRESFNEIIEECERIVLENALKQCAWNKSKVTQALKIPRQSLYNKIAKYHLERVWSAPE
jgi:DNA-binding NtrC family response regulator